MSKDRERYLEEAILNIDRQLTQLKFDKRNQNSTIADNLGKQRLHFQQELVKLRMKQKEQPGGLFGMMGILDDDDVIRLPDVPNKINSNKS